MVELDGQLGHEGTSRWCDIRRDNAAALQQLTTLRYGWIDITRNPCQVAADIPEVLSQRRYDKFHPCGPGCPVEQVAVRPGQA